MQAQEFEVFFYIWAAFPMRAVGAGETWNYLRVNMLFDTGK